MFKNWKNILILILLVGIFVEVLVIFPQRIADRRAEVDLTSPTLPQGEPQQKMKGIHLVESLRDSRDWELFADRAEGKQDEGDWKLFTVKVNFYNKNNANVSVSGRSGSVDGKSKDLNISGDVKTVSSNGYLFSSSAILYKSQARVIQSPGQIEMKGSPDSGGHTLLINGRGLRIEVDTDKIEIENQVEGYKRLSSGKEVLVKANRAVFSAKTNEAAFLGDVKINYLTNEISGPDAKFIFSPSGVELEKMVLSGGVQLIGADKKVTAGSLTFDFKQDKITFTGKPKVFQGEDEISGEEIVFLDGGKKVKVEKIRARLENLEKERSK